MTGLTTGQGSNRGGAFRLFRWEQRFLRGVFGQEFVSGDCALTIARGAGKTAFISGIGAITLTGPLIEEQAETVVVAPSLRQARPTFNHVKRLRGPELENKRPRRVWDTSQHSLIEPRKTGQVLRCVGTDPKRLYGLAPALLLADEPAQLVPNTAEATDSVPQASVGKIPDLGMIALGTRPLASQSPFFNALLTAADDVQTQACTKGDSLFQRRCAAQS